MLLSIETQPRSAKAPRGFCISEPRKMDRPKAHERFCSQRSGARHRGIEWKLTFDEWLAWWGADLDRRGPGTSDLVMCRKADSGPYALGNIEKGTPRDNRKTRANIQWRSASENAASERERYADALMWAKSKESGNDYESLSEDEITIHNMFSIPNSRKAFFGRYKADKR